MFFVGIKTTDQLELNTPLDFCCNCGARGEIERELDLVETSFQKTRYFFLFGSELELKETFPYCKRCRGSARRVRLGKLSKLLVACAVSMALFLVFVYLAHRGSLPRIMQTNLFVSSVFVGAAITLAYFWLREWRKSTRSYYQPISLVNTGDAVHPQRLHLKFTNASYARLFSRANSDFIEAGHLKVEIAK